MLIFVGATPARIESVTLSVPSQVTIPATSDCYQTFCGTLDPATTFTVSDTDYPSDQVSVICNTNNGWTFFWGMSMVTCHAHDPAGNDSAPVMFTVNVTVPPPTFQNVPGPITFAATGPAGAVATFVPPTAVDVGGQAAPVTCDHTSGITYPIGTTTVTCTAQIQRNDSQGNPIGGLPSAATQFTITITSQSSGGSGGGSSGGGGGSGGGSSGGGTPPTTDTTAPTIAQHRNLTVDATSRGGAVVTFAATATDPGNDASQTLVSCTPASGTVFRLGAKAATRRTTVTCQARDGAGNDATPMSFTVTVIGLHDQLASLELLVNESGIPPADKVSLTTTLAAADHGERSGHAAKARASLRSFIAMVHGLSTSSSRKTTWIRDATRAIAVAG